MSTRSLSLSELRAARQAKARRNTLRLAQYIFCTLLILAVVRYAMAEVAHADCTLTGRAIALDGRYRGATLRTTAMKPDAADSADGHELNLTVGIYKGNAPGESAPAHYYGTQTRPADHGRGAGLICFKGVSVSNSTAGDRPGTYNAYPVFPPYCDTADGDLTDAVRTAAGSAPAPQHLSSGDLWADNYCDTDSDILARRDLITEHFTEYGRELEQAEWVADVCIEFAQLTGADLWFTVGTVTAESGGNPKARNRSSGCSGLFQIHPVHRKRMAKAGLDFDLEDDRITFARTLYADSGWRPWAPSKRNAQRIARKLEQRWNSKSRE